VRQTDVIASPAGCLSADGADNCQRAGLVDVRTSQLKVMFASAAGFTSNFGLATETGGARSFRTRQGHRTVRQRNLPSTTQKYV
jgi:hypothetical protein